MSNFEFFMAFYGLLLGLAVAELLQGVGNLLRDRRQPRWGVLTPLLGGLVFVLIVTAFTDAWLKLQSVTADFRGFTVPALIGVAYFVAALLAVPRDAVEWPSLDDYFHARKRLTLGALLVAGLLTILFLEIPRFGTGRSPAFLAAYTISNLLVLAALTIPLVTRRTRVAALSLGFCIVFTVLNYANFAPAAGWTFQHWLTHLFGG